MCDSGLEKVLVARQDDVSPRCKRGTQDGLILWVPQHHLPFDGIHGHEDSIGGEHQAAYEDGKLGIILSG